MQTYLEAEEYTAPDLEAGLVAAVRATPDIYWEALDLLPANPLDGFAVHWKAWHDAATAIEANNPPPVVGGELDGAVPAPDPLAVARTLGKLYQWDFIHGGFPMEALERNPATGTFRLNFAGTVDRSAVPGPHNG